jgi:hypothetical protein
MQNLSKKALEALLPKIELVPIDEIVINPKNPRTITEKKFNDLVRSVENFWQMLFLRPIILDDEGQVLGGNMRTLAGRKAGFKYLPCIKARNLSDQQRAEFLIKDNIPFGDWNFDDLANNWDNGLLADWGMSLGGFKAFDSSDMNEGTSTRSSRSNKEPAPPPVEQFGIILKAEHELGRQTYIKILEGAGLKENQDYYLL